VHTGQAYALFCNFLSRRGYSTIPPLPLLLSYNNNWRKEQKSTKIVIFQKIIKKKKEKHNIKLSQMVELYRDPTPYHSSSSYLI
jgi:hypothetical protein